MRNVKRRLLAGAIVTTVILHGSAYATPSEPLSGTAEKKVTLHFYPSAVNPPCNKGSRHYLIVNDAGYYNSVMSTCAENGKFVNFWGWDNGRYTVFSPTMFTYWTALPEVI